MRAIYRHMPLNKGTIINKIKCLDVKVHNRNVETDGTRNKKNIEQTGMLLKKLICKTNYGMKSTCDQEGQGQLLERRSRNAQNIIYLNTLLSYLLFKKRFI
jgi:hypothetical protein